VRAGLRRARREGRRLGRRPLAIDRAALLRDRAAGKSLIALARNYRVSRSTVCRILRAETKPPQPSAESEDRASLEAG
jgi:DNA invertase Pin-like site-specific DNA recombinase